MTKLFCPNIYYQSTTASYDSDYHTLFFISMQLRRKDGTSTYKFYLPWLIHKNSSNDRFMSSPMQGSGCSHGEAPLEPLEKSNGE